MEVSTNLSSEQDADIFVKVNGCHPFLTSYRGAFCVTVSLLQGGLYLQVSLIRSGYFDGLLPTTVKLCRQNIQHKIGLKFELEQVSQKDFVSEDTSKYRYFFWLSLTELRQMLPYHTLLLVSATDTGMVMQYCMAITACTEEYRVCKIRLRKDTAPKLSHVVGFAVNVYRGVGYFFPFSFF